MALELLQNATDKTCCLQEYLPTGMDTFWKEVANQVTQNSRQQIKEVNLLAYYAYPCDLIENKLDDNNYAEPTYVNLPFHKCCSATTAANDDFELFQHKEIMSETVDDTEKRTMLQSKEKLCIHEPQSGERNADRYESEILENLDQAYKADWCADWVFNQNSEALKPVLLLRESNQNHNSETELSYHSNEKYNGKHSSIYQITTQKANKIKKTLIQNYKHNELSKGTSGMTRPNANSESDMEESNCDNQRVQSKENKTNLQFTIDDQEKAASLASSRKNCNLKLPHVTRGARKKTVHKQNMLSSLNKLDQFLLHGEKNDLIVQRRSRTAHHNKMGNWSRNDSSSSDERKVQLLT
jgi:hypothetical protein